MLYTPAAVLLQLARFLLLFSGCECGTSVFNFDAEVSAFQLRRTTIVLLNLALVPCVETCALSMSAAGPVKFF